MKRKAVKFESKVCAFPKFPGMHYLEVPPKIVKRLGGKFRGRFICSIQNQMSFPFGLMALGGGYGYIMFNKKRMKELRLSVEEKLQIEVAPDNSKYGMPLCEELKEVLRQDKRAKQRFDKISPGKQRNIIHYVSTVKNSDKRIDRAVRLLENLMLQEPGKEKMNEVFKLSRDQLRL